MGQAMKVIMFLIKNWSVISALIAEISKLFKGESTKEAVQKCVDGVCEIGEQKKNEPQRPRIRIFRRRR